LRRKVAKEEEEELAAANLFIKKTLTATGVRYPLYDCVRQPEFLLALTSEGEVMVPFPD
jgi:hypothetical protein